MEEVKEMNKKLMMSLKVSGVALAVSQAFAPIAMAQQADTSVVVVSGIRASAESALSIKKNSMEVVDSITAEDIGKLPDPNVAQTLTRIPGVQAYSYGGEAASPVGAGSGLTIRGLSGLTSSQVNGRAYFTAGTREFNIEDAIPAMVAGIDVFKNPSAEHIEGGIGGLVNLRTRNPSDFKGFTASFSTNVRENDLAKKVDPEFFGLLANKWDLGGGSRIGVMGAVVYQKSTARSDNNPGNGGANFKRAIRGDSAEYATMAGANTGNATNQSMSSYVGRSDVWFLTGVPTLPTSATVGANTPNTAGMTADQINNIMVAPAVTNNVFQETIMRERKGLNLAADYRVNNKLRFYTEGNYTYYLYHQNYRGLNSNDNVNGNVLNLQTTPFAFTEGLANRNLNGGSDDVLVNKRFLSGTFPNSTVTSTGGDEHRPYTTWTVATGAEWSPTDSLSLKADFSYIKATQQTDNRSVTLASAPGLYWNTTRLADGAPHQLTFSGPSLTDPANFVYNQYASNNLVRNDDKGNATALSGVYTFDEGFFNRLKFGTRYSHTEDVFRAYSFGRFNLTTDGKALTSANAISVASSANLVQQSPTNFMNGDAGYAGGYLVYSPDGLLGNGVRNAFPNSGIPVDGSYAEIDLAHSSFSENTLAGYVSGDFAALNDRLKGNVGVRVVRTNTKAVARVVNTATTPSTNVDNAQTTSYTNALPSFNATYDIAKDFLARFGYGKGMTRPNPGNLNPTVAVNTVTGTGNVGNAALRPQTADSFDFSLERYYSSTNYLSAAVFYKKIDGFFNGIVECQTVPFAPAYTGTTVNGCSNGQYAVTRQVNSEKGHAKGIELSGQYFFDAKAGWLKNFGVSGSYTYLNTATPINFGTAAAPSIVNLQMPYQSKNNYTISGMYEDDKWSARLIYSWRSDQIFQGAPINPIDGRYIHAYGTLDGALNYKVDDKLSLSFNAGNITNKALNRYVGEPGTYATDVERQHFANGRTFTVGLRYTYGNK
jgi:iron complex outermembrane recepter protein